MAEKSSSSLLQRIKQFRHKISFKLGTALLGAVVLTLLASIVGLVYLEQIQQAQNRVHEVAMPNVEEAFSISQTGTSIVSAVPELTSVQSQEELKNLKNELEVVTQTFEDQLDNIDRFNLSEESNQQLLSAGSTLLENITTVEQHIEQRISKIVQLAELGTQFDDLATLIDNRLGSEIDAQILFLALGYSDRNEAPVARDEHFTNEQINRYRYMVDLRRYTTIASHFVYSAIEVVDSALLETLKDQFETSEYGVNRILGFLETDPIYDEFAPLCDQLYVMGLDVGGIFEIKSSLLDIQTEIEEVFNLHQNLSEQVEQILENAVFITTLQSQEAAQSSIQAINTGRTLLLIVNVVSIVGAALIAFAYIGRRLLRRLDSLSSRMSTMAQGELEEVVVVDGSDEIGDMQQALEIFRKNALEVQRLNLVEHLADELSKKNNELEDANEELKHAQGQIVLREKLAALGELTAGVAHEIRNPMNFIKNFSESSEDLLEELLEEILENDGETKSMDVDIVKEISSDLTENFKRIRQHTGRANRIIDDMLKMGRDAHEFQESNINVLLEEHARLAFHSARATDNNFQLDIQYELDESIESTRMVPQDIGRLVINLVSNAGYACNEKRKLLLADDPNSDYVPTLLIRTELFDDGILITFRDNGSGIPESTIEKIFNPFFTTKPTDQGTGLGLALCNDIVGQHGGTMEVSSEEGEWTQMIIDLPKDPSQFMDV